MWLGQIVRDLDLGNENGWEVLLVVMLCIVNTNVATPT